MNHTSASARLQTHYDAMWERSFGAVASGDIECDTHLAAGLDLRRGLTLIARPGLALQERFNAVADRLAGAEPHQYRYPATDMHMTILSLLTVAEDAAAQLVRLADYRGAVHEAMKGIEAVDVDFAGVTISRSAVLAKGYPRGPALELLRDRLRTALRDRGLHASLDQRYRLVTAHTTLFRFIAPLQNAERLASLLARMRDEPFGAMCVDAVELVVNDWYMSSKVVERVEIIPVGSASSSA